MAIIRRISEGVDWLLVGSAVALTAIGVLLIYSAQYHSLSITSKGLWARQIMWCGVAFVGFLIAVWLPLRVHEVFAYVYVAIIGIILLVLLMVDRGGRWIGFGAFNIQPSEPAKLALMFALARYFSYVKRSVVGIRTLAAIGLIVVPIWFLVFKQPDLGTSLVFWALLLVMIFWAGAPPLKLFLLISPLLSLVLAFNWISWIIFLAVLLFVLYRTRIGMALSTLIVTINMLFGIVTPIVWNRLLPYQKLRLLAFLDPGGDPRGAGYQIIQSKVAIGSGGFWGMGFLEGSQTGLHFLPENHTDFVFAVAGEQFGFWGGILILVLFGILLWRTIEAGFIARNRFGRFVAVGAAAIIGFQMLVNVGMTLGLMPVTGLPLPFVSYGGSALVSTWFLTGLIVNVRRHWQEY